MSAAPLSAACRARVDCAGSSDAEPAFEDGYRAGYARAKQDALDALFRDRRRAMKFTDAYKALLKEYETR